MNPQIVRDIALKCDSDVAAAIHRNMALVDDSSAMATVAFSGATSAIGAASGAFVAVHHILGGGQTSGDEVADGLWSILRPMVVNSVNQLSVAKAGAA